jgi:exonuclease III
MRLGTWNGRSLYRAGSLVTVSKELSKYKLDLVGVQEIRQEGGGTEPAEEYSFFYGKRNENDEFGAGFLCIRESYQQLRGLNLLMIGCHIQLKDRWCHIIVLNVHATTEDKTDEVKDSFYEELEHVFDKFPNYHMKILLGDFNAKVGKEDIFKLTIGIESSHEICFENGLMLLNFATSKNLKVQCSHIATSTNILESLQIGKPTIRLTIF